MPNLMVHYGTTLAGGWALRARPWTLALLLGATWPDLPWIVLRIATPMLPPDLRLSASFYVQPFGSPFMCVWAGAIFACFVRPGRPRWPQAGAFTAAAWFHLLLDAGQTRYGNGVAMLYPFSLRLIDFEWFWEEGLLGWSALTVSTIVVGWGVWRGAEPVPWARPPIAITLVLITGYLAAPCVTWRQGHRDNTFGMAFVRDPTSFEGREVGFERNTLISKSPPILRAWYGREIPLHGVPDDVQAGDLISIRGNYRNGAIEVEALHVHQPHLHTAPSIAALIALMAIALRAYSRRRTT